MARDRASRPEARPLRLFVAIEIPSDVRDLVEGAVAPIREMFPRAKWVPKQNQHVTLKFLGSTYPRLVDRVTEAIGDVATAGQPFETRVDGLGAFPSQRRAAVLWAGLDDAGGRMSALASALDTALAKEFAPEERAFTPHLTVARFKPPERLGELPTGLRSDVFTIDQVVLFRSQVQRPAPIYTPVATFPLGA
ncbi:MAG TPA: RNA 2',3'-cyclic phosphodiesterase [Actinomycetota bacterium]|nr:RNA 2',3'-cyclic phosphodiesterase [Actinomycetota bacterium]